MMEHKIIAPTEVQIYNNGVESYSIAMAGYANKQATNLYFYPPSSPQYGYAVTDYVPLNGQTKIWVQTERTGYAGCKVWLNTFDGTNWIDRGFLYPAIGLRWESYTITTPALVGNYKIQINCLNPHPYASYYRIYNMKAGF